MQIIVNILFLVVNNLREEKKQFRQNTITSWYFKPFSHFQHDFSYIVGVLRSHILYYKGRGFEGVGVNCLKRVRLHL